MVNTVQMFMSPEGDVVEATPHEYVTRLKGLGYTRATPDAATEEVIVQDEEQPEQDVETAQVEQPTNVDETLNRTFRRQRDR